eukprot:358480-Chlamydomonas_euryale.AAC.12
MQLKCTLGNGAWTGIRRGRRAAGGYPGTQMVSTHTSGRSRWLAGGEAVEVGGASGDHRPPDAGRARGTHRHLAEHRGHPRVGGMRRCRTQ